MWLCQTRRETDPVSTNQPHQKLDEHKSLKQRSLPCGYKWHHNLHRSNVFHHCPCSTLTRPLLMHMYCATHTQMCRLASKFHLLSACIKQHWSWKVWHAFFHVRITCTTNACKSLNFLSHTHSLSLSLSLSLHPHLQPPKGVRDKWLAKTEPHVTTLSATVCGHYQWERSRAKLIVSVQLYHWPGYCGCRHRTGERTAFSGAEDRVTRGCMSGSAADDRRRHVSAHCCHVLFSPCIPGW